MEPFEAPEQDYNEAVVRFARDMGYLRSQCGMSIEEVHRSTKISLSILEEFEQSGLVENALFNRVYLRSFISTYASTIGIDRQRALAALDEALAGTYSLSSSGYS